MVPTYQPSVRSVAPLVLAVLLVVSSLAAIAPLASAQSSGYETAVSITNTTASTQTPTAGEPFSIEVTIANYEGSEEAVTLNDLVVSAGGDRQHVASDLGRLTPGSRTTVTVPVTLDDPGQYTVDLELYGSAGGSGGVVNVRSSYVVDVVEPQQPSLSVSVPEAMPGASRDVNVTVANGGDAPIRNVVLRVDSSADPVSFDETTRVRGEITASETQTFSLPARTTATGSYPVDLSVAYTKDGVRRSINRTFSTRFAEPANPGRVILSGVETTRRGGTLELSATASNVGSQDVGGVVVSVNGTDAVQPQTYFVGSIEASGFSSFSLQTALTGDVSTVSVEVRYVTGGVERSSTTEIAVPAAPEPTAQSSGGSTPLLGTPLYVAIGAVAVVLGGIVYWRRS